MSTNSRWTVTTVLKTSEGQKCNVDEDEIHFDTTPFQNTAGSYWLT